MRAHIAARRGFAVIALAAVVAVPDIARADNGYVPVHLRLGLGATAGGFIGTSLDSGFLGGFWGQIGAQFNRHFAAYYQVHAMLGGFAEPGGVQLGGFVFNEIMGDVTIGDVLQLGVGPSIDVITTCDAGYNPSCSKADFGLDARVGVAFGHWQGWQRSGFMLGVDLHPTFVGTDSKGDTSIATAVLLTLGGGFY